MCMTQWETVFERKEGRTKLPGRSDRLIYIIEIYSFNLYEIYRASTIWLGSHLESRQEGGKMYRSVPDEMRDTLR